MIRRLPFVPFLLFLLPVLAGAQSTPQFPTQRSLSELFPASPGSLRFGLYGYDNPALLGTMTQSELMLNWSDGGGDWNSFQRWGLFAGVPNFGFGLIHEKQGGFSVTDYRISLGLADRSGGLGIAYGWSGGDDSVFNREDYLSVGILSRPNRYLSIGLTGTSALGGEGREATGELAIRPLGDELITLFADYAIDEKDAIGDGSWSAGAVLEPLAGVRLTGRYFDTEVLQVGVGFSLGGLGLGASTALDMGGDEVERVQNTYSLRLGGYDRNIFHGTFNGNGLLQLDLKGGMAYQTYTLFDGRRTLHSTLDIIDAAREAETITGIAVNTAGMEIGREMLWEIRRALEDFKREGKYVVVYAERLDVDGYHFASVADRIVIDPLGQIALWGYASGRTYYREMLEKLGVGFDELRFFRFKSAYENWERDEMSEGERIQRQRMVDVLYELAREEIVESGRVDNHREFDRIVDSVVFFSAEEALAAGLVDTLAREDAVGAVAASYLAEKEGRSRVFNPPSRSAGSLERYLFPKDDRWGEPPQVAVVYAIGPCDLDDGIRARHLAEVIDGLKNQPRVKAVVVRVDSPGGDGLASDLVAEAMRRCSEEKPVIVSQGTVAASGGYWLSIYGDEIVAAPHTATGSIGVISAWVYNDGAFDSLGAKVDHVQRGAHADIFTGPSLPFIGLGLPERPFTDEERARVEQSIRGHYQDFIKRVADGREMTVAYVDSVGQGRVWMGIDALRLGLVDTLGGLDVAIAIARSRAGIAPGDEVKYVSYPTPGFIDPSFFTPGLPRVNAAAEKLLEELELRIRNNGRPMPMISIDDLDQVR